MLLDIYLYVALALGYAVGRVRRLPARFADAATLAVVAVLVYLLGASLRGTTYGSLAFTVGPALGWAALLLATTAVIYRGIRPRPASPVPTPADGSRPNVAGRRGAAVGLLLVASLLAGLFTGNPSEAATASLLNYALYVLLVLVGWQLDLHLSAIRSAAAPIAAAIGGAAVSAVVIGLVSGTGVSVAFATAFSFGWYSLAGPAVAASASGSGALLAFLTNFFRENLTMTTAGPVGSRLGAGGVAALGGATSMDTTLWFALRTREQSAGTVALTTGLVLTLLAGLVVPLCLAALPAAPL